MMSPNEAMFWAEVKAKRATSRSLKLCYAILIAGGSVREDGFWPAVHAALRERLDLDTFKKFDSFKCEAWAIYDAMRTECAAPQANTTGERDGS